MDALSTLLSHAQYLRNTRYYSLEVSGAWSYSIDSQDTIYFYLVQTGSFCIKVGEVTQKAYAGDIIMLPNAQAHSCYAESHHSDQAQPLDKTNLNHNQGTIRIIEDNTQDADFILVECQYDQEIIQPLLSVLPAILPEHKDNPEKFSTLDGAVGLITQESQRKRLGRLAMINLWASIVMIECLRTYIESLPETTDSWLIAMTDPHLSQALAIMHDAPNHNWTTHKLAREVGMSRSSFTERFKDIVGVPPLAYLTDYRLRIAAYHLRSNDSSIGQISSLVGYASNSTFSQAFKRVYGMSPKFYREQHQNKNKMA